MTQLPLPVMLFLEVKVVSKSFSNTRLAAVFMIVLPDIYLSPSSVIE